MKTAGGVTILEKSMAVFVLIIFDACLASSKLSEEGKVGHLEASDNQTRIRMPRQVGLAIRYTYIYIYIILYDTMNSCEIPGFFYNIRKQ